MMNKIKSLSRAYYSLLFFSLSINNVPAPVQASARASVQASARASAHTPVRMRANEFSSSLAYLHLQFNTSIPSS